MICPLKHAAGSHYQIRNLRTPISLDKTNSIILESSADCAEERRDLTSQELKEPGNIFREIHEKCLQVVP